MRAMQLGGIIVLSASVASCAAKAQVRTEVELPLLSPPPPPPRVVAEYPEEPEPSLPPGIEGPATPARPVSRPARPEAPRPEPAPPEPVRPSPPSLTLTPAPGTEAQTEAAIRALLVRAARDLARANPGSLTSDQRAQFDTARRFLLQAEDALKVRNLVYAGTLADKAATLAAVFAR